MPDSIDYYFTCLSPFAYLGHNKLMEISKTHKTPVNFKPFDLFTVWDGSGAVPPKQRPVVRQRYRIIELQRVGLYRNTCINTQPAFFPTDPVLADHSACAIVEKGGDAADFVFALGRAVWERNLDVGQRDVVAQLLEETGHNAKEVLSEAESDTIASIRQANTKAAIEHDAVGAPAYVYRGEVFWGQDRLEYLEQMIASGRDRFHAEI